MSESFAVEGIILAVIVLVIFVFAMLAGIYLMYSPIGFSGPGGPVYHCTISNESALEAAWLDGYRTGLSRAEVGNDTPGWSWNYSGPYIPVGEWMNYSGPEGVP